MPKRFDAIMPIANRPGFLAQGQAQGQCLQQGLATLAERHGLGETRGGGLLIALETLPRDASTIAARASQAGLLINSPQPNTLRFMPALNVSRKEIDLMLEILDEGLSQPDTPLLLDLREIGRQRPDRNVT